MPTLYGLLLNKPAILFSKKYKLYDKFQARLYCPSALMELFEVLGTPTAERDPYLEPALAAFPYVNGGLFADEKIEIPQFTDEIRWSCQDLFSPRMQGFL